MMSATTVDEQRQNTPIEGVNNILDQKTTEFLTGFAQLFAMLDKLPIPEQRARIKEMFCLPASALEPVAKVEDCVVEGTNGPITVRLFSPKAEGPLPIIVFLHRGGWVYGSLDESEGICRKLANKTGAIVAAVEYSLSPESKYPVPLQDCYDATKWLSENAASLSGDSSKVILCGESAGGNLAAAVALMANDKKEFSVAGQLLIYPVLTSKLNKKHYDDSPDKALLSYENMQFFWDMYLNPTADKTDPYISPLDSQNFNDLPQCMMVTAEHDALKHEGKSYQEALQASGVPVEAKCYRGVIHGFLDLPLADKIKEEAFDDIAGWVKRI